MGWLRASWAEVRRSRVSRSMASDRHEAGRRVALKDQAELRPADC